MNNTFKTITTAIALTAGIFAQADSREVVRIQYNDGIVDYIPADDIARISFARGVDTGSELYTLVNERFDFLKEILTFYNGHFAIGYGGIMIGLDCMTEDMNVPDSGYNWFREWCIFNTQSPLYHPTGYMWAMMYSTIHGCNSIISNHAASSEESRLLLAQAHALRSWAYWNLVQMYAPNYHFAPQAPGIVILPENSGRDGTYPLSTVEDVYSAILADINLAIDNLKEISMDPAHINVTVAKRYINLGAAYGLRARYKLTMHRYADAAADASMAIEASSGRPLLPAAAAYPGFNDAKLGNWMWAITINPDDASTKNNVCNFTSQICSIFDGGYCNFAVPKCCGKALHQYLEAQGNDVRRMWFTDESGKNKNLTPAQQKVVNLSYETPRMPYLNVKFDNYQGRVVHPVPASDIPLMRIEEMYLIRAEGLAMSGNVDEARNVLTDFVATYRNPGYSCQATDAKTLQDEIIWQRRAEFWGEGLVYFDKLRLQLDVDRFGDEAVPDRYILRIRGNSKFMLCRYPKVAPQVEGFDYEQEYALPVYGPAGNWNE